MILFPAIDLRDGKVVRLLQGDYGRQTTYANDPLEQARRFEQAGASWLHLVDLDGAKSGQIAHLPRIEEICAGTKLNVEVGGGVRNEETIDRLLAAGVRRVVLGTAALENWDWFSGLMKKPHYAGRIVLGLDARNGQAAVSGWRKATASSVLDIAERVRHWPLAAIIYTDITVDGTLAGPNLKSTAELAATTDVPIVASGGVGTLDHLRALRELPLQGVIVGKALYENNFTVEQALLTCEPDN